MYKYDFVHFFNIDSPVFNKAVYELIMDKDHVNHHLFVFRKENSFLELKNKENVLLDSNIINADGIKKYAIDGKILVIHGKVNKKSVFLKLNNNIVSRMVWCIWGHDLYHKNDTFTKKIKNFILNVTLINFFYKQKIKKFAGFFIGFGGDKYKLNEMFADSLNIYNVLYPSGYYLDRFKDLSPIPNIKFRIMIGHSASSLLKHKKYIDILKKYDDNIEVVIPLSYGDKIYASEVKKYAIDNLKNVEIIENFMDYDNYIKLVNSIDAAIFDFEQQAAFGNIILLLFLKKKIFLSKSGVMYKYFSSIGLNVFDTNSLNDFEKMIDKDFDSTNNQEFAKNLLDYDYISNQWISSLNDVKNKIGME